MQKKKKVEKAIKIKDVIKLMDIIEERAKIICHDLTEKEKKSFWWGWYGNPTYTINYKKLWDIYKNRLKNLS